MTNLQHTCQKWHRQPLCDTQQIKERTIETATDRAWSRNQSARLVQDIRARSRKQNSILGREYGAGTEIRTADWSGDKDQSDTREECDTDLS